MEYDNIKKLIDDMGSSKLTSLEIDFPDGMKISMKKDSLDNINKFSYFNAENAVGKESGSYKLFDVPVGNIEEKFVSNVAENTGVSNNLGQVVTENHERENDVYKYVKSPMVGTFYSKPSPDEECFIEVGDSIKKGATTCIIEAMKLMNEIESEFDGTVVEILKKDGDPVEYGENLIKLK